MCLGGVEVITLARSARDVGSIAIEDKNNFSKNNVRTDLKIVPLLKPTGPNWHLLHAEGKLAAFFC